jgi:hypothetical protein
MRLDELEQELRAQRPEPEIDFARRLDEWAEAGFPRDRGLGPGKATRAGALRRLWDRVASTPPRRLLIPAGAVATAAVIVGVAIDNGGVGGSDSAGVSGERTLQDQPAQATQEAAPSAADSAGAGAAAPPASSSESLKPVVPETLNDGSGGGGIARGAEDRIVDATARITLGADADAVQDVANGVVDVTDRYDGVVSNSEVTTDQGGARASFQLEIPYKHLDAALADLSQLGDVISRTQSGKDITAHAVRAQKDLARTLDQLRRARIELIQADTQEQRLVIKQRIASLKASANAQQAAFNGVKRQGRFATVGVDVISNGPTGDDGGWSLGDALDDAGHVLEVIGGVALIALAILLPLSLIAALAAFAISRGRRHAREKALDG